jgi:Fic family protein
MDDIYRPPFTLSTEIVSLAAEISELLGRLSVVKEGPSSLRLRRANRIRTIQGSLAIEGNTLSEDQITAILDGRRVIASPREILEVQNAVQTYENISRWVPHKEKDLLEAHRILMEGLIEENGRYRTGGVGIMRGGTVVHLAPPAGRVPHLIRDLLIWLKTTKDHPLIAGSVFHYEFEFIHPFADGNGRMGRLWQTLILSRWNPLTAHIPVEALIHENRAAYYEALNMSTAKTDSRVFIEYILRMMREAVEKFAALSEKMPEKMPEKVLRYIAENQKITIAELSALIEVSERTIERTLERLRKDGRLRRVGPDKGGSWEIRKINE